MDAVSEIEVISSLGVAVNWPGCKKSPHDKAFLVCKNKSKASIF